LCLALGTSIPGRATQGIRSFPRRAGALALVTLAAFVAAGTAVAPAGAGGLIAALAPGLETR